MTFEVEQKFPAADLDDLANHLGALGARFTAQVAQADAYFAHPVRDYASTDEALRLRRVGDDVLITYKGPKIDATTKTRREIELPLGTGERTLRQFTELLEALGFQLVAEVRKKRREATIDWQNQNITVVLDEVESLGSYVEIEIVAEEDDLDRARAAIKSLADELNLDGSERRSYLELLLAAG